MHLNAEQKLGRHQRLIEKLTSLVGRPRTIYGLLCLSLAWGVANAALAGMGRTPWDAPPFFWLQGALGLYAALVSTMVLTTQNRHQKHVERRAYLELQINLMGEQKAAKVISLLEELRRDLPSVHNRIDPVADAMAQPTNPEAVLASLEDSLESLPEKNSAS